MLQCNSLQFRNELAREVGVLPNFGKLLFTDPKLARNVFLGPAFTVHHRLVGPHAWAGAREAALTAYNRVLATTRTRDVTTQQHTGFSNFWILLATIVAIVSASIRF